VWHGSTCLKSQHWGGWDRRTRKSRVLGQSVYIARLCLKKKRMPRTPGQNWPQNCHPSAQSHVSKKTCIALLSVRHCSEHFIYILLHICKHDVRAIMATSFYRWGNWGTENQWIYWMTAFNIQTQVVWLLGSCAQPQSSTAWCSRLNWVPSNILNIH
jgi:hypothetical protein